PVPGKALLGSLPDRSDLGGEGQPDLRGQRRRADGGVAADEECRVHRRSACSGKMAGDDAGEQQPADEPVEAEFVKAIAGVMDVDTRRLPKQLHRGQGEPEPEPETQRGGYATQSPENRGGTMG